MDLKTVDAGGLTIAWRESGQGIPIIFLHGIGSGSAAWEAQLNHFGQSWRAIAWDAPGYGGSGDLSGDNPPVGAYADALVAFMDAVEIDQAHLVGNSLGALMISGVVGEYPARALSICLSDAAAGHGRKSEAERAEMIAGRLDPLRELGAEGLADKRSAHLVGSRASAEAREAVRTVMAQIRLPGYGQAAHMLANSDIYVGLEGCEVPAMVVCGSEDVVTPPESNREIAEFIGAPYHQIEGAGHLPYAEMPDEFNALLEEFLAGQERVAAE